MKHRLPLACLFLVVTAFGVAAVSQPAKHLTPQRVVEVTALGAKINPQHVTVEISGFSKVKTTADGHKDVVENIRELIYPTQFDPPRASLTIPPGPNAAQAEKDGVFPVTPTTPRTFETIHTGWTINLTTTTRDGLIEVYGEANWVEGQLLDAGYGVLSGPISTDRGLVITPNRLQMPRTQTTTTRFHLFALDGESYEVTLYRGTKAETHTIKVAAE